ncbi:hypothetical protein COE20_14150 [Bacillus cereus]|uniref:Uncharacterized protein n=1 Tax=Bacillus cereus TaxID=1396 RepID=A0A2C2WPL7_BACCE|nr:hypothetical protein CON05_04505 [Bacillus cereus]PFE08029.1 hypothetical protein CN307_29770 [Bacillus cereus]PFE49757.1 hypothetical protein CN317_04665 [Bacillus cereus]PFN12168.1 hypothetical protein COJ72_28365 [Bacillus cereus]PFS53957.1 hypothetical protein COK41_28135 [Bacillus cereus]
MNIQKLIIVLSTFNGVSATNTFDTDVADQNQIGTF